MKENFDLPEFQPNKNFWDKLESERSFEKQLSRELPHLPLVAPKEEAWQGIEEELNNQHSIRPFWIGVAAVFLVMVVAYILFMTIKMDSFSNDQEFLLTNTYSEMEIPLKVPKMNKLKVTSVPAVKETAVQKAPKENFMIKKEIALGEIEVPELSMPVFITAAPLAVNERPRPVQEDETAEESFHEVRVSWGINEKIKINTAYSAKNKRIDTERELSKLRSNPGKLVLRFSNGQ
ncbi:hypothetical protein KZP23_08810 [Echinicola marina]|uniref:hypothetical protein n=1 Tax=Echinicola marina TaxID=2859768 RepID=UPI001CF610D7|nr:hypothetical protein [Echinicola marina]UCS95094.1 hypothetical protein KZP23_08810 [Echinicola marina]